MSTESDITAMRLRSIEADLRAEFPFRLAVEGRYVEHLAVMVLEERLTRQEAVVELHRAHGLAVNIEQLNQLSAINDSLGMSIACARWGEHEHCGGVICACPCHAAAEPIEGRNTTSGSRTATAIQQSRERVESYLARHGLTIENNEQSLDIANIYYRAGRIELPDWIRDAIDNSKKTQVEPPPRLVDGFTGRRKISI